MTTRFAALTALAAGLLLFGGVVPARAATPPTVTAVYATTPPKDPSSPGAQPIVTLVGKGLTKITGYALFDEMGAPTGATVEVVLRSRSLVLLRLPSGRPDGAYSLVASYRGGSLSLPIALSDPSALGTVNGLDNPLEWTKLKGVPEGFADGVDDNPWTVSGPNVHRAQGRVGVGISSPAAGLHVAGVDGALFGGATAQGAIPAEGSGVRMMWYPAKSAFRAGSAVLDSWDDANVGDGSAAFGYGTVASAAYAFAAGSESRAEALGATALDAASSATGIGATALGAFRDADGNFSTAAGYQNASSGYAATAFGAYTAATGDHATALGNYATAQAFGSLVLGRYNVVEGDNDTWLSTDPVLVVGNGNALTPSNALTLRKDGNLAIAGTLTENSDARLKEGVAPLAGVLRRVAAIRGVTYRMRDGGRGPSGPQIGLVAQEVRAAFPELVHEDATGTLSVAYRRFTAVLLEAVREQQALLDEREREVAALRRELERVRESTAARLERLEAAIGAGRARGEGR